MEPASSSSGSILLGTKKRKEREEDEEYDKNKTQVKTLRLLALNKIQDMVHSHTETEHWDFCRTITEGRFSESFAFVATFLSIPSSTGSILWVMWANIMILADKDKSKHEKYRMVGVDFTRSMGHDLLIKTGIINEDDEVIVPAIADMPGHYESFYASIAKAMDILFRKAVFPGKYERQLILHLFEAMAMKIYNMTIRNREFMQEQNKEFEEQVLPTHKKHMTESVQNRLSVVLDGFAYPCMVDA